MSDRFEGNDGLVQLQQGDRTHSHPSTHSKGRTEETISPGTIELKERSYQVEGLSSGYIENGEKESYGEGDDSGQSGSLSAAASSNNLRECLICILRSNACSMNSVKRSLYKLKQTFPGLKIPERNADLSNLLKQIAVYKAPGVYALKDATRASVGPPLCTPTEGEHANFLSILEGKKLRDVLQRAKRMKCSKEVILSEEDFNSACLEYEEKYSIFFRVHQLYRDTRGARSSLKLPMHPNDAKVLEQLYSFLKEDLIKLKSLIEDFQSKCTNPTSHSNCNNK